MYTSTCTTTCTGRVLVYTYTTTCTGRVLVYYYMYSVCIHRPCSVHIHTPKEGIPTTGVVEIPQKGGIGYPKRGYLDPLGRPKYPYQPLPGWFWDPLERLSLIKGGIQTPQKGGIWTLQKGGLDPSIHATFGEKGVQKGGFGPPKRVQYWVPLGVSIHPTTSGKGCPYILPPVVRGIHTSYHQWLGVSIHPTTSGTTKWTHLGYLGWYISSIPEYVCMHTQPQGDVDPLPI